jgi:solute carrier family 25 citrate transporter 1
MPDNTEQPSTLLFSKYVEASVLGVTRGLLGLPIEKYKTLLITNNKNYTLGKLPKVTNPIKMAMRDVNIVYAHQIFGWGSFLMTDEALKKLARADNLNQELSTTTLLAIGVTVGIVNTIVSMPFDTVKTLLQKDNPWPNQGIAKTMYKAYQTFGISGLYAGWEARIIQYMLQAYLTVNLWDKLKNDMRDNLLTSRPRI